MKSRFSTSAGTHRGSPFLSSVLSDQTPGNVEVDQMNPAGCLFELFLTLPHDIPYVRQHLHDSVSNFCSADPSQSIRIDLEQKPHGTHYRIHVRLNDLDQFSAVNHELASTVEKFAGVSHPKMPQSRVTAFHHS